MFVMRLPDSYSQGPSGLKGRRRRPHPDDAATVRFSRVELERFIETSTKERSISAPRVPSQMQPDCTTEEVGACRRSIGHAAFEVLDVVWRTHNRTSIGDTTGSRIRIGNDRDQLGIAGTPPNQPVAGSAPARLTSSP